jgi:hypothetical protein
MNQPQDDSCAVLYYMKMKQKFLLMLYKKRFWLLMVVVSLLSLLYYTQLQTLTFSTTTELEQMVQLEAMKTTTSLLPFQTDGCSGGISSSWSTAMTNYESVSLIHSNYSDVVTLPFESACIEHDKAYHQGIGGYTGRLEADSRLRSDIIEYGIANASDIQNRANLASSEHAIRLYEFIADTVYRGVRLGGAPCTDEAYAWGYGDGAGSCEYATLSAPVE